MRCAECNLPVEEGDFYMEVLQKKQFGEPKKCTIHAQCITKTQGRTLRRQR